MAGGVRRRRPPAGRADPRRSGAWRGRWAAGWEAGPMTQITGHAEFCELFLDDVIVPKETLLSERGDGWKIAMHTLGHERGTAALPRQVKLRTWVDRAARDAARRTLDGRPVI